DVVDAELAHGNPLRAHAEGEAAEFFRIVAAIAQHNGMHHARAHDFQPAAALAQTAAFAAAVNAVHVHFNARFREWEIARANAHLPAFAKHPPGECGNRAFQVGHGHVGAYGKTFDLVEHDLAANRDRLIAVAHAGQNHADRLRTELAHHVNLAGGG